LHISVEKCQREVSYVEFLKWIAFFVKEEEDKFKRIEKEDYYLAQIAAMVIAANSKDPGKIKVTDFLIKLDKKDEQKKLTKEERAQIAKKYWMGVIGSSSKAVKKKRTASKGKR
jgi:hypothetical protein